MTEVFLQSYNACSGLNDLKTFAVRAEHMMMIVYHICTNMHYHNSLCTV